MLRVLITDMAQACASGWNKNAQLHSIDLQVIFQHWCYVYDWHGAHLNVLAAPGLTHVNKLIVITNVKRPQLALTQNC